MTLFSAEDVRDAAKRCDFNKAIGIDGFDGKILGASEKKIQTILEHQRSTEHEKNTKSLEIRKIYPDLKDKNSRYCKSKSNQTLSDEISSMQDHGINNPC